MLCISPNIEKYFDGESLLGSYVQEGDEFETLLITNKGIKKKYLVQFVNVIEPDPQDPILHAYFILKDLPYNNKERGQACITIQKTSNTKLKKLESVQDVDEISGNHYE